MSAALAFPAPTGPMSRVPSLAVLARIAEEADLGNGVRIAGELVRGRFLTSALADALHARYFRGELRPPAVGLATVGRRGADFWQRLGDTLQPYLFRRDGWRFSYRTAAGVPSFEVATAGDLGGPTAGCFLHLQPGTAPDVFARFVTTLDGYGLGFRAVLAGDPAACRRADTAVVTVRRDDVPAVARAAQRQWVRAPFALSPSAPAFTRQIAPGVALADQPGAGTSFGRHRCGLVAAGLVAAGHGADAATRRATVLDHLTAAGLDPAAPHLNPGNPEFRL